MLAWAARSTPAYFLTAHDLDLVRWFVDDEVAEVYAQSVSRVLQARGVDTPDVIQTSVRFRNGAIASFESSWIMPNTFPAFTDSYLHILGSQGTMFLDRGREALEVFSTQNVKYPKLSTVYEHEGRIYGSFRHALEHFVDCARTDTEPLTAAAQVYGVVAALEAIHESLETRQPVAVQIADLVRVSAWRSTCCSATRASWMARATRGTAPTWPSPKAASPPSATPSPVRRSAR